MQHRRAYLLSSRNRAFQFLFSFLAPNHQVLHSIILGMVNVAGSQMAGGDVALTVSWHYSDVIMGTIASQITSLTIVYSNVYSDADQRKHQSSASLAFVRGIHREPVNSPHKWPVTRKMFPFDDVIMGTFEKSSKYCLPLHSLIPCKGTVSGCQVAGDEITLAVNQIEPPKWLSVFA